MTFERFQQALAIVCVPNADHVVVGARCDLLPVWRISYTADPVLTLMSIYGEFRISCNRIPYDQSTVIATRRYVIVDGREGNSMDLDKM